MSELSSLQLCCLRHLGMPILLPFKLPLSSCVHQRKVCPLVVISRPP